MNLQDIRKQYPQYNDLSDTELADGFHKKFYSDIPKKEFYSKIGIKQEGFFDNVKNVVGKVADASSNALNAESEMMTTPLNQKVPGKEFKGQYPNTYAALKTASDLIPFSKYIDPDEREAFMKLTQKGQTNQLLKDTLEAEIFVAFPTIAKTVGGVVGALGERVAPKLTKALTKERNIFKKPVPEVPQETPVPKVEEPIETPIEKPVEPPTKKPSAMENEPIEITKARAEQEALENKIKTRLESEPLPPLEEMLKKTETPIEGKQAKSPEHLETQSRVFERLQQEHPEALEGSLGYNKINLEKEAETATNLIANDKQKAYRLAMNMGESAEVTNTAVNIAMSEKALQDGNLTLYSKLVKNRSLAQTRRGQEIVSEKGSVSDNDTSRYVRELVSARLERLGKKYLDDLKGKLVKKSNKEKAISSIDREIAKAQGRMSNKLMDIKEAQSIIDSLICK